MIKLPNIEKAFEYENNFYLSCDPSRIGKVLVHYELFKQAVNLPGVIMEFGVFKGISLVRFAIFRSLFSNVDSKKIVGFDTFSQFPEATCEADHRHAESFVKEAGSHSISTDQLHKTLKWRGLDRNVELIEGNICDTGPDYVKEHPELRISLLHLDVDLYEPTKVILDYFYSKVVNSGVIIFDDYATFGGETKAIDEFFEDKAVDIRKFPFSLRPSYMVKKVSQ